MAFQFKQFSIAQSNTAMKVGTDGVLLGAWCTVQETEILDIGTGTGLIALMLAQRTEKARIDGVEIEKEAYCEALENVKKSEWSNQITIEHTAIQNYFPEKKYGLIISNPPFFNDSTKASSSERNNARHTDTLSFSDLINSAVRLLKSDGIFSLILPTKEAQKFSEEALERGLYLLRKCLVKPNANKPTKRVLMEFSFSNSNLIIEELTIETETRHLYTKEYISLTKEFYLKF